MPPIDPGPAPQACRPGLPPTPTHPPTHPPWQVAEGSDADVIIFDPTLEHTIRAANHHSAMDTNIYEGYRVQGKVRHHLPL